MSTLESAVTVADLRAIDLFDDLSDTELAEWAAVARWVVAAPAEVVIEAGVAPVGVLCLTEGALQIFNRHEGRFEPTGHQYEVETGGVYMEHRVEELGRRYRA